MHHVGLGVAALVHGRAADEIKEGCKTLFFQDRGDHLGGLGSSGAQDQPGVLQALQHFCCTGVRGAFVAALHRVAFAVKAGGLLDLVQLGEVLAEALAQRRAQIAAQVDAGDVHAHFLKDLFQCMENAGSGINQGPVHVKQDGIVMQQLRFPHFHGDTVYSIAQIVRLSNSNKCIFRFLCKLSVKRW